MKLFSLLTAATGIFAAGLVMAPLSVQAAEATASVNVRSGPGTQYRVVDTLRPGQQVDIDRCATNGWCYVIKAGPDGWVSSSYLDEGRTSAPPRRPGTPDIGFSVDAPNFSFSFGNQGPRPGFQPPRPPQSRDLVCLVTFERPSQVAAGRDSDVVRARLMDRRQAERIDRPNDRNGIFTYGSDRETRRTCNYLDRLN